MNRLLFLIVFTLLPCLTKTQNKADFKIRTITAGVTLSDLSDTTSIISAIKFLKSSKKRFVDNGYDVQTIRISTQNLHELTNEITSSETFNSLKMFDQIAMREQVSLAIGEVLKGNSSNDQLAPWLVQLVKETANISFSIPISSSELGVHYKSIKSAAEVCKALSENSRGGEANFRFTASANCPPGIPFFPAAYHKGPNSFAIGLESPNLLTKVFSSSDWQSAEQNLINELEMQLRLIENLALALESESEWKYDGIDTSPAPGLDASIGLAIETLTGKPFGSSTTLSACSIVTNAIKNLDIKTCGYSGLMLPVIEDKVLAKRAMESQFTVEDLLLFSSVSGTGLDVIPLAGNLSLEDIEGVYRDVAALSIKYQNKALSARLFPIPGKSVGDIVDFDNPYLTRSVVMKLK